MHSHVLFSLLAALASCQTLVQAAPVAQTDATVPFPEKTVTVTETFTLIREIPMSAATGLALSELPNGLATGEQSAAPTTVVSPDLSPVEEILSSYYAEHPQTADGPPVTASFPPTPLGSLDLPGGVGTTIISPDGSLTMFVGTDGTVSYPTAVQDPADPAVTTTADGLALSELPNAAVTGDQPVVTQEGTTIVSPDASNTSLLPPPAVITSEFPAVLPEDAGPSQNATEPVATGEVSQTEIVPTATDVAPSVTEAVPPATAIVTSEAAPTGTGGLQPPVDPSQAAPAASDIVPVTSTLQDGYSILPIATATDTLSASAPTSSGDPQAQAPVAGGCNSTAPAVKGEGKAGLGWMADSGECAADFLQAGSKVSWGWNWANKRDLVPEVLDYVPVLFDGKNETITDFRAAEQEWGFGVSHVMSLYEPHLAERANVTAEAAATIHKDVMNVMEGVYKIGGPVMSQDTTGSIEVAKKWYTDFYVACHEDCKVDFLPIAIYGTDITKSIGQITEWYNLFGASNGTPVWIVEMDCRDLSTATGCPAEAAEGYARGLMDWADATEWVERYAWFDMFVTAGSDADNGNSLVTSSGTLSALGQRYAYGPTA